MEGLLYQHGVDAVFTGHVHAYERVSRSTLLQCPLACVRLWDWPCNLRAGL